MKSLTPRERLLAALRREPVDRVPVWMMRQAGRYLPEYQAVRARHDFIALCKHPIAAAEVSVQPIDIIGSDAVIIFNDILIPLENAGAHVEFHEGEGPRIANPVRTAADLASLAGRPIEDDEPVAATIREARRRVGPDFPILGFIGAPWTLAAYWVEGKMTRNFESLLALRWRDPELLDAILERVTEVAARYLHVQIAAGADAVQIFDTWGSALSDVDYERFSGRWIRRIVESVRASSVRPDIPVIAYLNGCTPYLPTLATLGADCLSIDWRLELSEARRAVGPGFSLQGNLDPLVLYATPDAVEGAVRDIFARFPPATGHVFNLGHGILPRTPVENAKRLVEAVKRHGVLA